MADDGSIIIRGARVNNLRNLTVEIPRGKLVEDAACVGDFDWLAWRARHSTGWKSHKYRHQWEHKVRVKEKHMKSQAGKRLQP